LFREAILAEINVAAEILNLIEIMEKLRSPSGCPWDKRQTPESLKPCILEEAYELLEAIDNHNSDEICDELGDLLFQVVFLAQIFSEQKKFGLAEVAHSISEKLQRRHPHVFADASADSHAKLWEEAKHQERLKNGKSHKLKDCIPANLPALKKATKVVKRRKRENNATLISRLQKNISKLSTLIEGPPADRKLFEIILGDMLFNTVQLSHSLQIDAEDLLRQKTIQVMQEMDQ
jgi:MazG family protein